MMITNEKEDSESLSDNKYKNEEEELTKGILDSIIDVNQKKDINEEQYDDQLEVTDDLSEIFNDEEEIKVTKRTMG